jgi:hypothetical protein
VLVAKPWLELLSVPRRPQDTSPRRPVGTALGESFVERYRRPEAKAQPLTPAKGLVSLFTRVIRGEGMRFQWPSELPLIIRLVRS